MLPALIVLLGKEVVAALHVGKALGHKVSEVLEKKIQPSKQFEGWRSQSMLLQQRNLANTVTNRRVNK